MKYIALIFYIILFVSCSTSKFYKEVSSLNDGYHNELVEKYGKDAVKKSSFNPHKLVLKALKERIQNTNYIIYHYSPLPKWKSKEFAGVVYDVDNSKYYYLENSEERPRKIVVDTVYDYPNDNYYKFIIDNYLNGKIEYLKKLGERSNHSGIRTTEHIYVINLKKNIKEKYTFEDFLFMNGKPTSDIDSDN